MTNREQKNLWDKLPSPVWTLLAVVVGGVIASGANYMLQLQQFNNESRRASKEKRAEVYLNFLEAANAYNNAADSISFCISRLPKDGTGGCTQEAIELADARFDFQGAINEVYVYGSNEAWEKSHGVAAALPDSSADKTLPHSGVPIINEEFANYDRTKLNSAHVEFQTLMCKEVPAEPRSGC